MRDGGEREGKVGCELWLEPGQEVEDDFPFEKELRSVAVRDQPPALVLTLMEMTRSDLGEGSRVGR